MVARTIEVTRRGRKGEVGDPGVAALEAVTTGGSSTVYTITNASPELSYFDGYGVAIKMHVTNGATPTANLDTLGPKPIKRRDGGSVVAIEAGDMIINQFYVLHYSSDEDALLLFAAGLIVSSEILTQSALPATPGAINFDPVKSVMSIRNIFTDSSLQVGQELVAFVVNNTGVDIDDGKVVEVVGYDPVSDALEIGLSIADTVDNALVLGVTTGIITDGSVGFVTEFGRVNELDTILFSEGERIYLSDSVAGDFTNIKPAIPVEIGHVGAIHADDGFIHVHIRELETSIYGAFSDNSDQSFVLNTSTPITFNSNDEVSGITHSESVDTDEFTFTSTGVYQATIEPQHIRSSGGGTDVLNIFVAKDTGAGFVNIPNSNVKLGVNAAAVTNVSPLTLTFRIDSENDKIRFMAQTENILLILDAYAASGTPPNDIPATPSVLLNIVRIGD